MKNYVFVEKRRVNDLEKHKNKFLKIVPSFEQCLASIIDMYKLNVISAMGTYKDFNAGGMPLIEQKIYSSNKGDFLSLTALNLRFNGGYCLDNYDFDSVGMPEDHLFTKKHLLGLVKFDGSIHFNNNIENFLSHYTYNSPMTPHHNGGHLIRTSEVNDILKSYEEPLDSLPFKLE